MTAGPRTSASIRCWGPPPPGGVWTSGGPGGRPGPAGGPRHPLPAGQLRRPRQPCHATHGGGGRRPGDPLHYVSPEAPGTWRDRTLGVLDLAVQVRHAPGETPPAPLPLAGAAPQVHPLLERWLR